MLTGHHGQSRKIGFGRLGEQTHYINIYKSIRIMWYKEINIYSIQLSMNVIVLRKKIKSFTLILTISST